MSWGAEFGASYEVPRILDFLDRKGFLVDISWHNEMMPSFAVTGYGPRPSSEKRRPPSRGFRKEWDPRKPASTEDPVIEVRLWIDHPIINQRENVDTPRFGVMVGVPVEGADETWEFHEVYDALVQVFKAVIEKGAAFVWEPVEWNKIVREEDPDPEALVDALIDEYSERT